MDDGESTIIVDRFGYKRWADKDGKSHRDGGPAIIDANNTRVWYVHGRIHREDGPAVESKNGSKEWWINDCFYKTKEEYFGALSDEAKMKCLFSKDFLNG